MQHGHVFYDSVDIICDAQDDDIPVAEDIRLGDDAKNSDAADGPQSKLVQDIRSRQAEQEALAKAAVVR